MLFFSSGAESQSRSARESACAARCRCGSATLARAQQHGHHTRRSPQTHSSPADLIPIHCSFCPEAHPRARFVSVCVCVCVSAALWTPSCTSFRCVKDASAGFLSMLLDRVSCESRNPHCASPRADRCTVSAAPSARQQCVGDGTDSSYWHHGDSTKCAFYYLYIFYTLTLILCTRNGSFLQMINLHFIVAFISNQLQ